MIYKRLSHCIYCCDYHIVISTKYRRKIFNNGIFSYLELKLKEITKYYPYINFKEVNHDKDHLHLLVSIPPTTSVGKIIGIIKANTAKGIKKKFPPLKDVYWGTDSIWSEGYFVSTIGINQRTVQQYIQKQGNEDAGQTLFG